MEAQLADLLERLKKAHSDRLVSVILYGSAAGGELDGKFSDLNVLCVLDRIAVDDLAASERVVNWWRGLGNPSPLLMTETEVRTSTDCFPIEFEDMLERRRVLFGKDVIEGLQIDRKFYRAQVEYELRSKLLRLRQKGAGLLGYPQGLLRLMADSVSTFLVLTRHALLLSGVAAGGGKRAIAGQLGAIGVNGAAFRTLLDFREQKIGESLVEARPLFEDYLNSITALVEYVDRLDR